MKNSILVTGGAGFIGSHFVAAFSKRWPDFLVVNLDKLTYAGSVANLEAVKNAENHVFIQGDVCDAKQMEMLFSEYDLKGVIHFAAETHVDNSLQNPAPFVETNFKGTFQLLEAARKHWMVAPFEPKEGYENCRFLQISTDEVYGTLGPVGAFSEASPFSPNNPYSATKAGSDLLVRSYFQSFGIKTIISHGANTYGPWQHTEKLIPTILSSCIEHRPIPIYGTGENVRDWLYVADHAQALERIFMEGSPGESYNVASHQEKSNLELTKMLCQLMDAKRPRRDGKPYAELITLVKDRPGHDLRYAMQTQKLETQLHWSAQESLESGLAKTVDWFLLQAPPAPEDEACGLF